MAGRIWGEAFGEVPDRSEFDVRENEKFPDSSSVAPGG